LLRIVLHLWQAVTVPKMVKYDQVFFETWSRTNTHNLNQGMAQGGLSLSKYKKNYDFLQDELHDKYYLRPRPITTKHDNHPQPKKLHVNQTKDK